MNVFDLNSGHVTQSYYRTPDGRWNYIEQEEGLAQGCPLSPPFSSLVLARIMADIHADLDISVLPHVRPKVLLAMMVMVLARAALLTWMTQMVAFHTSIYLSSSVVWCGEVDRLELF